VLDLNLPDGVGTTILQRIRDERRAMKVAVATGADEGELLAEARRLGPDLLLRKPYNVNELLKWLDTVG
jgi:DNA-binding response OmpR family regulator